MSRRRSCTRQEVLDKLDPAHTGSVFVVGGDMVQRVAQFQNDRVTFGRLPSLEGMARRWPEVTDMSDAKPGTSPV